MKAAINYIPIALLACLLTVAGESIGRGEEPPAPAVLLAGEWSGAYSRGKSGGIEFSMSVQRQSDLNFSGVMHDSPLGTVHFRGTLEYEGLPSHVEIVADGNEMTMEGTLQDEGSMSGEYKTTHGTSGYWELFRR